MVVAAVLGEEEEDAMDISDTSMAFIEESYPKLTE